MKRTSPLVHALDYLKRGPRLANGWAEENPRVRDWEDLYRGRWQHDKVTRSTHGVNCTGSCSWRIYTKDGIITWETQQTDYPPQGPDFPDHEPRGCPRGASTSWYEYSPIRVRYPYVRGSLLGLWRAAKAKAKDPVEAWQSIVENPDQKRAYMSQRGKGGFVRAGWDEITELIAAASIYTIKAYGPDRIAGFSPIPAMSMVSYSSGARFLSLIGGTVLSFYDWYADLPMASPQIWGDQTDVPESADWYNSRYMIIWGTNLPLTRTPDAHFMVEARYRGLKVAAVAPDYAEYVKFADTWLPAKAGTDAALAMAMTHVILKEFYADKQTEYFTNYVKQFTDLPFLVRLQAKGDAHVAGGFVTLQDLGGAGAQASGTAPNAGAPKHAAWKPVVWDAGRNGAAAPNGSIGYRWDGSGKWNLRLEDPNAQAISPLLTFLGQHDETVPVDFPYFGATEKRAGQPDGSRDAHAQRGGQAIRRHVPVKRLMVNGQPELVTTVFDLMMANVGVSRGLPGAYPQDFDDPQPYTPAWQEAITGVDRKLAIQVAREFADTAARTGGRAMITMGAGTNHWYHSDMIYRAMINLVLLTGCEGVNGGGWAHYVGQEKIRPLEGLGTMAFASDWLPASRQQNATSFFYFATEQFRYDEGETRTLGWPGGDGRFTSMHPADMNALAVRLGWLPGYPQFRENSLETMRKARAAGAQTDTEVADHVAGRLVNGDLQFAIEHPDDPRVFPRLLFIWRSNLLTSTGKGHEYFLSHLLGADGHVLGDPVAQPETIEADETPPQGKLDLLIDMDFRMTASGLYADIVLPAATWYEKHDLSSTDMHAFVHPFTPAISPPWETKTDWVAFLKIAAAFSKLAEQHLPAQEDLLMTVLAHDSPFELAQEGGHVRDWRKREADPIPGQTMPRFFPVKRDYPHIYNQMIALGPRAAESIVAKGVATPTGEMYHEMLHTLGPSQAEGPGKGMPSVLEDYQVANAILGLSGPTNGKRAVAEWKSLERVTSLQLAHVAQGREDEVMTLNDLINQPRLTLTAPVWSGLESHERRYAPFTVNTELGVPWRTLTGRQHFYLDHEVLLDFGEGLPLYRPPLEHAAFAGDPIVPLGTEPAKMGSGGVDRPGQAGPQIVLRYLTPHQKWGIHTTFWDIPIMLYLFRGGQTVWMNDKDAAKIGIKDNDWIEVFNRNGAVAARAVVSHRIPEGVCMQYHAQDRTIGVPGTNVTGDRGGAHNSLTRIIPKPTHMVGGYGHLSYGFNYIGPTGHQRDEVVIIRPLREVRWLES
ncbi:MAG: nitrate reductase subunit alpha [Symbiobacteriia bacterium]